MIDDGVVDAMEFFSGPRELYLRCNKRLNIGRKRQLASDIASGEFIFFFEDLNQNLMLNLNFNWLSSNFTGF